MTPVHWIIQENQGDSTEVSRLVRAVESEGHVAHLVHLTKSLDIPPILDLPDNAPLVCHGPGFVTRAPLSARLKPGLFFDPETFRWQALFEAWGEAMLSRDGRVMALPDAQKCLRNGATAFVRPDADSKLFEGAVYDSTSLAAVIGKEKISSETPVVVASPLNLEAEWRFFVVDREIVGCSEYKRWGHPSTDGAVPHKAIELAADVAHRWSPAEVFCLDVAAIADRVGVVEANCFNASRFYGSVIERVVRAVSVYVLSH